MTLRFWKCRNADAEEAALSLACRLGVETIEAVA